MVGKLRVEYAGAIYRVMNRGDRREPLVDCHATAHGRGRLRVVMRAAEETPAAHLSAVSARDGSGDGVVMDIQADVEDNVHVSAFLSGLCLTDQTCGSALRPTPGATHVYGK